MSGARERLQLAQQFLFEAKELVEQANNDVVEELYRLGEKTPLGARAEVVNDLYWSYPDLKTADIAEAFGYGPRELTHKNIIKPHYRADLCCPTCGTPHTLTSRSRMVDLERDFRKVERGKRFANLECDICREARFAERDQQFEREREARAQRLHELRTMRYRDYLNSPEWQMIRQKKLRSARFCCELCNSANTVLDVHHKTYERRGQEHHRDLIVLCRDCHAKFHDKVETQA